jgi:hypothetical protein
MTDASNSPQRQEAGTLDNDFGLHTTDGFDQLIMSAGHLERRAVETFGLLAVGQPCENYSDVRMCRDVSRLFEQ